jgi:ROS/MUCR transcriptional regulator protein
VPETSANYVELSADIVSAYVSKNAVTRDDLPALIASVHTALSNAANGKQQTEKVVLEPPVSVKKSITANHLISMEDGRPYKSLKRHLTARGPHSGAVSGEMVAAVRLPDGRAELLEGALGVGEGSRLGSEGQGEEGSEEARSVRRGCRPRRGCHAKRRGRPPSPHGRIAIALISTFAPSRGKRVTSTVVRAGGATLKKVA